VFDPETSAFLETGCALVVGTVTADGAPYAARAWGADPIGGGSDVRVLLDALDVATIGNVEGGGRVAVTATSVRYFTSVQMKGHAVAVEPATAGDRARAARYVDDFFADIEQTDGTERALLERLVPADYVAMVVRVEEVYDQTPGPGAGGRIERRGP
jgi:predicted pyridoxine 5'-phosphate oxidase superfamily flavin-nucleotide-binding protein